MLDSSIFEPAHHSKHSSNAKNCIFEDSSVKFYSFIEDDSDGNDTKENEDEETTCPLTSSQKE